MEWILNSFKIYYTLCSYPKKERKNSEIPEFFLFCQMPFSTLEQLYLLFQNLNDQFIAIFSICWLNHGLPLDDEYLTGIQANKDKLWSFEVFPFKKERWRESVNERTRRGHVTFEEHSFSPSKCR